jgi:hypothetical protein
MTCECREDVLMMKAWLGSELGYDNNTVGNVNRHLRDLGRRAEELERKQIRNSEAIYGNGVEGLKTRVAILESTTTQSQSQTGMFLSIGLSAFSGVVAIIAALMSMGS